MAGMFATFLVDSTARLLYRSCCAYLPMHETKSNHVVRCRIVYHLTLKVFGVISDELDSKLASIAASIRGGGEGGKVVEEATEPIEGMKPGTSGLRKKVGGPLLLVCMVQFMGFGCKGFLGPVERTLWFQFFFSVLLAHFFCIFFVATATAVSRVLSFPRNSFYVGWTVPR